MRLVDDQQNAVPDTRVWPENEDKEPKKRAVKGASRFPNYVWFAHSNSSWQLHSGLDLMGDSVLNKNYKERAFFLKTGEKFAAHLPEVIERTNPK